MAKQHSSNRMVGPHATKDNEKPKPPEAPKPPAAPVHYDINVGDGVVTKDKPK